VQNESNACLADCFLAFSELEHVHALDVIKRLGEFSPIGRLFTLDCLMKITEIVQFFGFFISKIFLHKEWTKNFSINLSVLILLIY
jgi:hypothetical protein